MRKKARLEGSPVSGLQAFRQTLPAFEARKKFLKAVKHNQCVVVVGETGSGKTTQCPQFLVEAGYDKGRCIACTQPRRVAAMSVAHRVAEEMGVELGEQVGYRIRFEDVTSDKTVLKYCTDGSLLREAQTDPQLTAYSVVILDEAHERTLDTDILMGLLKELMSTRKDLKVVVMSATLDAEKFQKYFSAPVINIPGRVHPVEVIYSKEPESSYFDAALRTILDIHAREPPGDILVFMTGEEEIDQLKKAVDRDSSRLWSEKGELRTIELYSSLPPVQQQRIFEDAPKSSRPGQPDGRKCIIATNIAETSITIDGIVYVVDPGFSKQKAYNPRTRVESLLVSPISKASAKQRAGRAGRTRPGKCYRLYTEESFKDILVEQTFPEILRSNLGRVVLTLLKLGIKKLVKFPFMEPPAVETMMRALEELHYLNAIDEEGQLTPKGEMMSEFPVDPQIACMIVESKKYKCVDEALIIAAMLSVPTPFVRPREYAREAARCHSQLQDDISDHYTLITVYEEFVNSGKRERWCYDNYLNNRSLQAACKIYEQLRRQFGKLIYVDEAQAPLTGLKRRTAVRKCVCSGFFLQVCVAQNAGKTYKTISGERSVLIHPSSGIGGVAGSTKGMCGEHLVYNELVMTTKNYVRTCSVINIEWIRDICPQYYKDFGLAS